MPVRFYAAAFLLFALYSGIAAILPAWRPIAGAWAIVPGVAFLLWEFGVEPRFRLRQRAMRRDIGRRHAPRGVLEEPVAQANRRHTLFAWGSAAAAIGFVAYTGWGFWRTGMGITVDALSVGLFALSWLLCWPARKVDTTHLRRCWVD